MLLPGSAREEASEWLHARVRKLLNAGPEGSDLHLQAQQGLYSRPPPVRSATRRGDTLTGVYVTVQDVIAFSEALAELVSKAQDRLAQQLRRLLASSKHVADSALWLAGTGDALRAEALDKLARARGARQAEIVKNVEENASVLWARFTGTSIPGARPKVLNPEEVERRIGEITQQASTSIKQVSFVSYSAYQGNVSLHSILAKTYA